MGGGVTVGGHVGVNALGGLWDLVHAQGGGARWGSVMFKPIGPRPKQTKCLVHLMAPTPHFQGPNRPRPKACGPSIGCVVDTVSLNPNDMDHLMDEQAADTSDVELEFEVRGRS